MRSLWASPVLRPPILCLVSVPSGTREDPCRGQPPGPYPLRPGHGPSCHRSPTPRLPRPVLPLSGYLPVKAGRWVGVGGVEEQGLEVLEGCEDIL